jgi:hypothetical protein
VTLHGVEGDPNNVSNRRSLKFIPKKKSRRSEAVPRASSTMLNGPAVARRTRKKPLARKHIDLTPLPPGTRVALACWNNAVAQSHSMNQP